MDSRAERESVNKMYLHPGGLWARCERQERIALSSAVNIEAESLRRLAVTNPLAEYVYPVLELDFEPSGTFLNRNFSEMLLLVLSFARLPIFLSSTLKFSDE